MGDTFPTCSECRHNIIEYRQAVLDREAMRAEMERLRDSDAANLKVIQQARKALGLPAIGCQPGELADAGLVAECDRARRELAWAAPPP